MDLITEKGSRKKNGRIQSIEIEPNEDEIKEIPSDEERWVDPDGPYPEGTIIEEDGQTLLPPGYYFETDWWGKDKADYEDEKIKIGQECKMLIETEKGSYKNTCWIKKDDPNETKEFIENLDKRTNAKKVLSFKLNEKEIEELKHIAKIRNHRSEFFYWEDPSLFKKRPDEIKPNRLNFICGVGDTFATMKEIKWMSGYEGGPNFFGTFGSDWEVLDKDCLPIAVPFNPRFIRQIETSEYDCTFYRFDKINEDNFGLWYLRMFSPAGFFYHFLLQEMKKEIPSQYNYQRRKKAPPLRGHKNWDYYSLLQAEADRMTLDELKVLEQNLNDLRKKLEY